MDSGMKKKIRDSRAVSPVVGVMLMLVVAVVLAAVVSSFAGGLAGTQKKAPQASFDAVIRSAKTVGDVYPEFVMKHLGGDPVPTKDVKIVTKWYNESIGKWEVAETIAVAYNASGSVCYIRNETNNGTCEATTNYTDVNTHYSYNSSYTGINKTYRYNSPWLAKPGDLPADNSGDEEELWFGNYVMQKGDVIKVQYGLLPPGTYTDVWGNTITVYSDQKPPIANATYLKPGDIVTVELIDLTTNAKIFSKEVVVQ